MRAEAELELPESETHQLTEEEMRKMLEVEGLRFELAEPVQVPEEFNLNALEAIKVPPKFLQDKLKTVIDYLMMPYVYDNYGKTLEDQDKRRVWRQGIIDKYGEVAKRVFKANKLGGFHEVYMWIDYFADQYRLAGITEDPLGTKLIELQKQLPPEMNRNFNTYKDMEVEDKARLNGKLSNIAIEFLQLLAEKPETKH